MTGDDVEIIYTGLRPGEKLHEELFHHDENISSTEYEKIHLAANRKVEARLINQVFDEIVENLNTYESNLSHCLHALVPEYQIDEIKQTTDAVQIKKTA